MPHQADGHRTSRDRLAEFREQRFGLFIHWGHRRVDPVHGRPLYGAGPSAYQAPPDCRYTQSLSRPTDPRGGDRLYVHLLAWPYRHLHLPGLAGKVRYAPGTLTLQLPVQRPDVAVPVIELFL